MKIRMDTIILVIILFLVTISGCASNEYNNLIEEYEDTIILIYKDIDCGDIEFSYSIIRNKENNERIVKLGKILSEAEKSVPEKSADEFWRYTYYYDSLLEIVTFEEGWEDLDEIQTLAVHLGVGSLCDQFNGN